MNEIDERKKEIIAKLRTEHGGPLSRGKDFGHIFDDEPFHELQAECKIRWNYDCVELEEERYWVKP